eukprot:TRINITY_DN16303_c0_g1_i1.p1 TRINITY_DN16303_c0_g1~~TRINITY_DN16303_c0_g1_i1.p1  ORF type:complete len:482 (+),score=55.26 TRINITY_DN16303_c0_g1_i1:22-1446(+)
MTTNTTNTNQTFQAIPACYSEPDRQCFQRRYMWKEFCRVVEPLPNLSESPFQVQTDMFNFSTKKDLQKLCDTASDQILALESGQWRYAVRLCEVAGALGHPPSTAAYAHLYHLLLRATQYERVIQAHTRLTETEGRDLPVAMNQIALHCCIMHRDPRRAAKEVRHLLAAKASLLRTDVPEGNLADAQLSDMLEDRAWRGLCSPNKMHALLVIILIEGREVDCMADVILSMRHSEAKVPAAFVCNVITRLLDKGFTERAFFVFSNLRPNECDTIATEREPNTAAYNALAVACSGLDSADSARWAFDVVDYLLDRAMVVEALTYRCVLNACERLGPSALDRAKRFFNCMRRDGSVTRESFGHYVAYLARYTSRTNTGIDELLELTRDRNRTFPSEAGSATDIALVNAVLRACCDVSVERALDYLGELTTTVGIDTLQGSGHSLAKQVSSYFVTGVVARGLGSRYKKTTTNTMSSLH